MTHLSGIGRAPTIIEQMSSRSLRCLGVVVPCLRRPDFRLVNCIPLRGCVSGSDVLPFRQSVNFSQLATYDVIFPDSNNVLEFLQTYKKEFYEFIMVFKSEKALVISLIFRLCKESTFCFREVSRLKSYLTF